MAIFVHEVWGERPVEQSSDQDRVSSVGEMNDASPSSSSSDDEDEKHRAIEHAQAQLAEAIIAQDPRIVKDRAAALASQADTLQTWQQTMLAAGNAGSAAAVQSC